MQKGDDRDDVTQIGEWMAIYMWCNAIDSFRKSRNINFQAD